MIYQEAFAKINLSLDIIGKREDGYHDLKMVMQSVSLRDKVGLSKGTQEGISVRSNLDFLPTGEGNLAGKSAREFWNYLNLPPEDILIEIEKKIPVSAGLAGGSTDAATVLHLLNQALTSPLSLAELQKIGLKVGADVPYCLMGGTALAEGVGEILTPLPDLPPCFILLCKPSFSISTPKLFSIISQKRIRFRPDTAGLLAGIHSGDTEQIAQRMFNVFEQALNPHQEKTISEIKNSMLDYGALGSSMSGSGPTVLGIFSDEDKAKSAEYSLKEQYAETFLTVPVSGVC